jgi:peptidoglycan hydrolase-like protein with peptidoglycan-binding domain
MQTKRTMALLAVAALLPALAAAQQTDTAQRDTTRGNRDRQAQTDTTRNRMDAQGRRDTADEGRRVRGESRGSVGASPRNLGLTRTQVTMLQQALRDDGCDPGRIDGIVGPRTRRAIACAYQENDLDGRNLNELFRALDLSITVEDSLGVGAAMRSGAGDRARTGRETDANRDRTRDRAVDRDSSRVDSLQQRPTRDTAQTTERPPAR